MFTTVTFGIALLAALIIPRIIGGRPLRLLAFAALGAATVYTGFVPLWGGVLIALAPILFILLSLVYFYWVGQRALSGKLGEEQKWIAEMVQSNDTEFMNAMARLDQMTVKEAIIEAESKDELRQIVLERADE